MAISFQFPWRGIFGGFYHFPGVSINEGNLQISKWQNLQNADSPIQRRDHMTSFIVRFSNKLCKAYFLFFFFFDINDIGYKRCVKVPNRQQFLLVSSCYIRSSQWVPPQACPTSACPPSPCPCGGREGKPAGGRSQPWPRTGAAEG